MQVKRVCDGRQHCEFHALSGFTVVSIFTALTSVMLSKIFGFVAPSSHDGWLPEMCGFRNFGPASCLRSPFCICSHVPIAKNLKFASAQKNFQTCVTSVHESVSAHLWWLRDSLVTEPRWSYTTAIHCVRFQISWQLTGKGDRWQDRQHTDRRWRAVSLRIPSSDTAYC